MELQKIVVKTYKGNQENANREFQYDAARMAEKDYYPVSQSWSPGNYGCGSFIVALLLCFVLIGIVVFIYMLIVKPDGTLSVTYELKIADAPDIKESQEKTCPMCAESVKSAAKICRFCGHPFS